MLSGVICYLTQGGMQIYVLFYVMRLMLKNTTCATFILIPSSCVVMKEHTVLQGCFEVYTTHS